jgi:hypothetical protein
LSSVFLLFILLSDRVIQTNRWFHPWRVYIRDVVDISRKRHCHTARLTDFK